MRILDIITERQETPKGNMGLTIFDIDDTLFHTTAEIKVIKDGNEVRSLTNQEFNNYQLQPGEEFDFGEFRSAEKFAKESEPIRPMINTLKRILNKAANTKVIMLTARADFDDKDKFLNTFEKYGIDMSKVHVHRAGNLPGNESPAYKKAIWVRKYLNTGKYNRVNLIDDSMTNLKVFKSLESEYPQVDFDAYFVHPSGSMDVVSESRRRKKAKQRKQNSLFSRNTGGMYGGWGPGSYGGYGYDSGYSGDGGDGGAGESVEEDWRSKLATGAMAGAMAMGADAKAPQMVQQIVEPGDTVYSIARQNNLNPVDLLKINKMDRNTKLEIGQKVLVPDYSKPVSKMPATVTPTVKQPPAQAAQPTSSLKDKISSFMPKFSNDDEEEGVTLLSDNPDAEAALQTAAKAAGLKGVELAQFMAQTRHESWDFSKMKEVGNKKRFAKYDVPRKARQLGNKVKGDGELFKGRGFIQLTGRDNYTRASQYIFGDDRLVKNPDLVSNSLEIGAKAALWFWKTQVRPAVKDFNNTVQVVKAINANEPAHVVKQRHNKFKEYLAVL